MQLYAIFAHHSKCLGNFFVTLKYLLCDVPDNHKLYANKEQNCSEPWLAFLYKWLQSLWLNVSFHIQNCAWIFLKQPILQIPPQKITARVEVQWGWWPWESFLKQRRIQNSSWKCDKESKARHCWYDVWHHLVETRLISLECHIPSGKRNIHHSEDWGKHQKWWLHTINEQGTEYSDTQ
jgi:hypothetical protein